MATTKGIVVRDGESREMELLRILHNRLNAYGWNGHLNRREDGTDITVAEMCQALRDGYQAICDTMMSST